MEIQEGKLMATETQSKKLRTHVLFLKSRQFQGTKALLAHQVQEFRNSERTTINLRDRLGLMNELVLGNLHPWESGAPVQCVCPESSRQAAG